MESDRFELVFVVPEVVVPNELVVPKSVVGFRNSVNHTRKPISPASTITTTAPIAILPFWFIWMLLIKTISCDGTAPSLPKALKSSNLPKA